MRPKWRSSSRKIEESVERVHSPGLKSHPGYKIAKRQMSMFGGMLSFEAKGGREAARAVAAKTKIFTRATSLGGVESLIEHRASIEGPGTTSPGRGCYDVRSAWSIRTI